MTTVTEGNLQITFPGSASVRRFDDEASHGLSHCMKAVDFIVDESDRVLFIELKDPEHPDARDDARGEFIASFLSGNLDKDLQYKFRDTWLYEWASGNIDKPIYYCVIVAVEKLTDADLLVRTDNLNRKLPLQGPPTTTWTPIVTGCIVFNIRTWNKCLPRFPLSRVPT